MAPDKGSVDHNTDRNIEENLPSASEDGAFSFSEVRPLICAEHRFKDLGDDHEATYLEEYYNLIIVVLFLRLGVCLKYECTVHGFWVVATLFYNFW